MLVHYWSTKQTYDRLKCSIDLIKDAYRYFDFFSFFNFFVYFLYLYWNILEAWGNQHEMIHREKVKNEYKNRNNTVKTGNREIENEKILKKDRNWGKV